MSRPSSRSTTAALSADTTATAEAVDVPALVVTGELDKTCPVVAGEAVAKALGTELVVLGSTRARGLYWKCPTKWPT